MCRESASFLECPAGLDLTVRFSQQHCLTSMNDVNSRRESALAASLRFLLWPLAGCNSQVPAGRLVREISRMAPA